MSVGSTLSEARVKAGLTLEDVAERTRIRRTLIENIEHDDFHACGGDFYARGHVKSIAQTLHIDPAPLLAEFDGDHLDPDLPTASGVLDTAHVAHEQRGAVLPRPNWSAAMALALVAVLAFGAFHLLTASSGGGGASAAVAGGGASTEAPTGAGSATAPGSGATGTGSPTAESSTAPTDAIAAVPAGGVTVVVTAVGGRSWVSATGKDAGPIYQNVLGTGQAQTMRDDRGVKLVIGNAGAVRLVVNGHDLGSPGGTGQVVRLSFAPGDPSLATG